MICVEDNSESIASSEEEAEYRIDFPKNKGFFNRRELIRLALCIDFNTNLFTVHFAHLDTDTLDEEGVASEQILDLLNTREFNISIHKTMNIHTQEYNEKLIRKVVRLLGEEKLGFSELKQISRVFSFYEGRDGNGMPLDNATILSALKMCDRVIGPLQLKDEIARRRDGLEVRKHLAMYELIDYYKVSQSLSYWEQQTAVPDLPTGRDTEGRFILSPPNQLEGLQYERILTALDEEYRKLIYQPVQTKQQKVDLKNLVNPSKRMEMYERSREELAREYEKYKASEWGLWRARAGYFESPQSTKAVVKKRKKGTVAIVDYRQLDTSRYPGLGFQFERRRSTFHEELSKRDEEIIDLKWEMIRSQTKYEKKLRELREKNPKEREIYPKYDPIPNLLSSVDRTFKSLQEEIKSPKKKQSTHTLPKRRKSQITNRFEPLDDKFVREIMSNWVIT